MNKIKLYKKYFYIFAAICVGALFFYVTYQTPLAGDDWGYAINGMKGNPFLMAISFYSSWSGRFFSELWGFIAAPNKWIWNIINPLLFVVIFLCIYKISKVKKYYILVPILILAIMLSVDDNLRMETYSWLMGTTYVIPLALAFVYFVIIDDLMFNSFKIERKKKTMALLDNVLLFYIGLTMENIAAMMIAAIVILIIYAYFEKKNILPYLWVNFAVSAVAFLIMRMSPGSAARLVRDNAEWASLGLFEKITSGYSNFINYTFINNNYLILFASISIILLTIFSKKHISKIYKVISLVISSLAIFAVFSFVFIGGENIFVDPKSIFSSIFWPIYTINVMAMLYMGLDGRKRVKAIFMFMVAGGCNLVMLYSPIFGARSSLYTVYFLIPVMCILLESIDINKYILLVFFLICIGINADRLNEYLYKYKLVGRITSERNEQIKYYQDHPEVEEVWIRRYPIYTIHGADIENGDNYHFETFKEYYHLPQSADKITFYFKETEAE